MRSRRSLLDLAKEEVGGGTLFPKPGNSDVLVYKVGSRPLLRTAVLPFLQNYMRFSARVADFERFAQVLRDMELGWHREPSGPAAIARIAYAMNAGGKQRRVSQEASSTESSEAIRWTLPAGAKRWSDLHGDVES
jgi:hypothetical protein